eukprot:30525-Lingulodinium_polyedra.AAC.1
MASGTAGGRCGIVLGVRRARSLGNCPGWLCDCCLCGARARLASQLVIRTRCTSLLRATLE